MARTVFHLPQKPIERKIYLIREERVLLDEDLSALYGVRTRVLIQAVKRNKERFPADFMFQLSKGEFASLRSHFGISRWGGRRYAPYAFTEQGVAMLSSVLQSNRAIQVNIAIIRAFVHLREVINSHKELAQKFKLLEMRVDKQDEEIRTIFEAIRQLMTPPEREAPRRIGFGT